MTGLRQARRDGRSDTVVQRDALDVVDSNPVEMTPVSNCS